MCLVLSPAASAQTLLVVNKSGNSLSLIDVGTRASLATIATGTAPHEVAVSPDGRWAFVSDYGTGAAPGTTVTMIDVAARAPAGTIPLGKHTRPHGIAAASDGTVWVTTEGSQHVLQLDPQTQSIRQAVRTGQRVTHQVVIVESASRVYTANIGSGTATAVDAASGRVLTHVATGAGAEGIDVAPDGSKVYVTNREAGTLSEVDVATNAVTRELMVGDFPIRVRVRPDGREVLVSNARGNEVVAVDLERWEVVRRLAVGAMPVGILVSPDNRRAFVANTQDDRISVRSPRATSRTAWPGCPTNARLVRSGAGT
jgi:YVTN family beta-propeller protein